MTQGQYASHTVRDVNFRLGHVSWSPVLSTARTFPLHRWHSYVMGQRTSGDSCSRALSAKWALFFLFSFLGRSHVKNRFGRVGWLLKRPPCHVLALFKIILRKKKGSCLSCKATWPSRWPVCVCVGGIHFFFVFNASTLYTQCLCLRTADAWTAPW